MTASLESPGSSGAQYQDHSEQLKWEGCSMRRKDVKQEDTLVKSELPSSGQVAAGLGSPDAQVTWAGGGTWTDRFAPFRMRLGVWFRALRSVIF